SILFNQKKYTEALVIVQEGLDSIKEFFTKFDQADAFARSNEVKILKKFARDIRKKLPIDPIEKLKSQLEKAVAHEQYEDAARLRDEIKKKTEEVERIQQSERPTEPARVGAGPGRHGPAL